MKEEIKKYIDYLIYERNYAQNTTSQYNDELRFFFLFCQERKFDGHSKQITDKLIKEYLYTLYEKNQKVTRSKKLSILRGFFQYQLENGRLDANPCQYIDLPKKDKKLPKILAVEEIDLLLEKLLVSNKKFAARDLAIVATFFGAGVRVSELVKLVSSDIDFLNKTIFVRDGKGGKARFAPLSVLAVKYCLTYSLELRTFMLLSAQNPTETFFLNKYGNPLTSRGVNDILKRVSSELGIGKVSAHMFRHSFATALLNGGADLRSVQELLGHESIASTQVYTHVSRKQLESVYQATHPLIK
ncbi:MAG: tyrosine-type recombinase/integrase [Culicoidibacterales bacterium]